MNPTPLALPRHRGFTLIEVMIVVAIISILSMIAIPSYRDYIIRGQLTEATTALSSYRGLMERYYQDNRTYANVGAFVPPCNAGSADSRKVGLFQVSCTRALANEYIVEARGTGSMTNFVLRVNERNDMSSSSPADWGGECATRWILKRKQTC